MSERQLLQWEDIPEDPLDTLFSVWSAQELKWAKRSWGALTGKGLTGYTGDLQWTQVIVRLMALATIYKEFCDLAWDEWDEPMYAVWASELGVVPFRVAQCLGPSFDEGTRGDGKELLELGINELIDQARPNIYEALRDEFGSDSGLFIALWRTQEHEYDDDPVSHAGSNEEEDDYSIVNEVTAEKCRAFEWIREGMHRVH